MKKVPIPEIVAGVLSVLVGLVSLCGGGIRLMRPEAGVAPEVFDPAFESGSLQAIFYGSVGLWIALSLLLVVAGGLQLTGARVARTLGLIYAWGCVGTAIVIMLLYAARVVPLLSEQSLDAADIIRVALAAPVTGCCPTLWAVALLGFLHSRPAAEPLQR